MRQAIERILEILGAAGRFALLHFRILVRANAHRLVDQEIQFMVGDRPESVRNFRMHGNEAP